MTSTSFSVGLNGGRTSSRVLRPPGGGHTDIFGGEPEPQCTGRRIGAGEPEKQTETGTPAEIGQRNSTAHAAENADTNSTTPPAEAVASTDPAPEAQPIQVSAPVPEKPEPIPAGRRGRVPPGGFSTQLW